MSVKAWAEFLGFQKFDNLGGYKPLFKLFTEPPTLRNGTTVTLKTLEELKVEIPPVPNYVPRICRKLPAWKFCCNDGFFTFDKVSMINHIRREPNRRFWMEIVTIETPSGVHGPEKSQAVIWLKPKEEKEENIQPNISIPRYSQPELQKESKWSPWAQKMAKEFDFPLPEK